MSRAVQVTVTGYDEITTTQGEVLTMYMIQVQYGSKSAYCIAKRYSDFSTLHQNVKDILTVEYKFPNKSMFNNSAQFTKDRRRRGFNDLLQILASMEPLPEELQVFLEMKERINFHDSPRKSVLNSRQSVTNRSSINPNTPHRASSINSQNNTPVAPLSKMESDALEEATAKKKLLQLSNFILRQCEPSKQDVSEDSDIDINAEIKKIMPKIMKSSVQISAIAYLVLILLGVVDVSQSSYAQIAYTFVAIVAIGCFLQIRDARSSMVNKSS